MASTINATTSGVVTTGDSVATLALQTGGNTAVAIDNTGNVGIGTSAPNSKLHVSSTTSAVTWGTPASQSQLVAASIVGDIGLSGGSFAVRTNTLNTTYASGLGIDGTYNSVTSVATINIKAFGPQAGGYSSELAFWTTNSTSSTQRMTLSNAGNLQVPAMYGTTVTTPRNVFIDSSGNMGGISSVRASKTNISALNSAAWVQQLNPVTFNYRKKDEDGAFTEEFELENQFGLIAEEVETIQPDLCIYVDGKLQGVHYDRMIAPLIKAIQELTDRISQLETK